MSGKVSSIEWAFLVLIVISGVFVRTTLPADDAMISAGGMQMIVISAAGMFTILYAVLLTWHLKPEVSRSASVLGSNLSALRSFYLRSSTLLFLLTTGFWFIYVLYGAAGFGFGVGLFAVFQVQLLFTSLVYLLLWNNSLRRISIRSVVQNFPVLLTTLLVISLVLYDYIALARYAFEYSPFSGLWINLLNASLLLAT